MSPERSNLVLSSNIPYIELHILVGDGLHVKANSRYRCDILVELQLVKNC